MRVMVVGASANRAKFGNKAVRAYINQGHQVFPVNPHAGAIEGVACFAEVLSVPGPIDRVALYVPPNAALGVVQQLAGRGDVREIMFNPGTESEKAIELAARSGMNPVQACAIMDVGVNPYAT